MEGKWLLVLLAICLQIFTCSCSSLTFQTRGLNSWEILIGANAEKEFQYDICRYDASENIERCKNNPRATVSMRETCNCSVNRTENAKEDSLYFTIECNNETLDGLKGACPQKLAITYEQGDVFHPDRSAETLPATLVQDENCSSLIWTVLFFVSLVINLVSCFSLFVVRSHVLSWYRKKWGQLNNTLNSSKK